jgi:hypothetical protein
MEYKIDPQHPGSIIRCFLIAETLANLVEAGFFLFAPGRFLKSILAEGVELSPPLETLLQCFGILFTFGITFLTALGIPNTPTALETRKSLYLIYAVIEAVGISYFWYLGYRGPEYSGFDPNSCRFVAKNLVGPFAGRLVALWNPDCFGKLIFVADSKKK